MRTTLTLDPDVQRLLEEEAHRRRQPWKTIVNDAIRRGLGQQSGAVLKPYRMKPHRAKLAAGVDPVHLNRLVDELETETAVRKLVRR